MVSGGFRGAVALFLYSQEMYKHECIDIKHNKTLHQFSAIFALYKIQQPTYAPSHGLHPQQTLLYIYQVI